jgi:hypothetical protein
MTASQIPADFTVGQRVQLAPHTDLWMRGARYGVVTKTTRQRVHVKLDRAGTVALPATSVDWNYVD